MRFNPGDEVIVVDGEYKGHYGSIVNYEDVFDMYFVYMPDFNPTSHYAFPEDKLELLDPKPEAEEPSQDDEGIIDIPVHGFGISQDVFQRHLEYLIGRSLTHVGEVGAKEAFFGFQEFEGKSASEVLLELMMKLEEGMAMFAQAHILIGRIVAALEIVHEQAD